MKQLQAVAVILLCLSCEMGHSQPASLPDVSSKIWIGRYHEMEEYLRTADCDRIEVFKPSYAARCTFKPGGPISQHGLEITVPRPESWFSRILQDRDRRI